MNPSIQVCYEGITQSIVDHCKAIGAKTTAFWNFRCYNELQSMDYETVFGIFADKHKTLTKKRELKELVRKAGIHPKRLNFSRQYHKLTYEQECRRRGLI